jgi:hypothetical protein
MKGKEIIDRNPLTDEEVAELVWEIIGLDFQLTSQVLLLCHAFTHEMSYSRRESMMEAAVARVAVLLPAFDSTLMSSMAQEVAALKGGAK